MSDSSITLYDFEDNEIRVSFDKNGDPLFIANDLCRELDIKNPRQAVSRLDDDEKGVISTDTLGGKQDMLAVTEPGLYSLALSSRSKAPRVKRFKRWVTHELLPTIRKQGAYISPNITSEQVALLQEQVSDLQNRLDDSYRVNRWLATEQRAGEFITRSLPSGDQD